MTFIDKKHFGDTIHVFDNETNYLCVIEERGVFAYYIISSNQKYWYPINTYIKRKRIRNLDYLPKHIEVDLKNLGKSKTPIKVLQLLKNHNITQK